MSDSGRILSDRRSASAVPRTGARVRPREPFLHARTSRTCARAGYLTNGRPARRSGDSACRSPTACGETRRLAYWAPATALGTNMHTYWCGVASQVRRLGRFLLRLDPRGGREGRDLRRRPRRDRATTCPCCFPRHARNASPEAIASPAARPSAASRPSGPSSVSTAWTRATRRRRRSCTDSCGAIREGLSRRADLGRARHARHPQRRHDSRGRLHPRRRRSPGSCRRARPASISSCCRSSPGP